MASAIDPSKPADGVPAAKLDLRNNLQAARDEIEALQASKTDLGHQHVLADVTDAGALAGKSLVAPGDIAAGAVATAEMGDAAVVESKLADAAVTTTKLAAGAVTEAHLAPAAVATPGLADGAVTAVKLAAGAVTDGKLAPAAVTEASLAAAAVTTAKLADAAVTESKLAPGAVGTLGLANDAVISAKLVDNAVIAAKLAAGAVTTAKLANAAVTSGKLASGAVTSVKIAAAAVGEAKLADGAVSGAKLASAAVSEAKLAAGAITDAKLAAGAVTTLKLAAAAVNEAQLADGAVTTLKLANDAVSSAKLAAGAVGAAQLADGAVTAPKLAAGAVGGVALADDAVSSAKLAAGAVGTVQLADGAVTRAKLAPAAVGADELEDGIPIAMQGAVLSGPELRNFAATSPSASISGGVLTVDFATGNVFEVVLSEDVASLALVNPPAAGRAGWLTLILRQDETGGRSVAWPSSVVWAGGSAPTVSSEANATDIYTLITRDGGTVWYGRVEGQGFGASEALPSDPLALVYPYVSSDNVMAGSAAALASAVNGAPPGRHVHLTADLSGETITFSGSGAEGDPIVVRPDGAVGSRTMSNCTINLTGSWIVLAGFDLPGTTINWTDGSHNRITRNTIRQMSTHAIVLDNTVANGRIDHNDIGEVLGFANAVRFQNTNSTHPSGFKIDHNYFHHAPDNGQNGTECIRYGLGGDGPKNAADMNTHLWRNLIDAWDSDDEIMTVKARGMTSEGNTLINIGNQDARWSARTAGARFYSDWLGDGVRALRVLGDGCEVVACRLAGSCRLEIFDGNCRQSDIDDGTAPGTPYPAAWDALIRGCVLDTDPGIDIEVGFSNFSGSHDFKATGTIIEACVDGSGTPLTSGNGIILTSFQENTTITSSASGPFTPAVKLTIADVGPDSFDPYHGDSGPTW